MRIKYLLIIVLIIFIVSCKNEIKKPTGYFFDSQLTDSEKKGGVLTPEILWKFGRIGEFRVSHNNGKIVYTVKRYNLSENKGNTEIFVVPVSGGEPQQLTYTNESENNVQWSVDDSKLWFLSSKSGSSQIWEINSEGRALRQISHIDGDIESFQLSPNGEKILFTMRVKTDTSVLDRYPDLTKANARSFTDLMYRHWDSWTDYMHSHVFVAHIGEDSLNKVTDIMVGEPFDAPLSPYFDAAEVSWAPDGKSIAYTSRKFKGVEEAKSTNSDIYLYSLETGKTKNLTKGMNGYDRFPSFSPDGKLLAFTSMATAGYESDKDRLMLLNFENGLITDITANFDQSVANLSWKNNEEVLFVSCIEATHQVYTANVKSGIIKQITAGWHDYISVSFAKDRLVGEKMSISAAAEIYSIADNGAETQLTFTNKNIYDFIKMGEVKEHWITTTDNKKMLTWFILPPGFDSTKKYPALLFCEGGPQSPVSQFFSYRWNLQLMAANGYIVVAPNRRGLPGFGQAWNDQIALDYGGQNMKDYLSATDFARNEPYVNAEKMGAVGASYGGYSVYYLAGHHQKRFKAFIAHCGIFNMESEYASTEEFFFVDHDYGGPFWQTPVPKSYQFSPHRFVQNWDTPIMMITGEKDFRIPYTESLQAFNAAQLRGIPSKLLIFPDETHWVVKPQNSVLWQREFFGWLDKWLK